MRVAARGSMRVAARGSIRVFNVGVVALAWRLYQNQKSYCSRTFLLVDAKTPEGKSNLRQQKSSVERFLLVDAKTPEEITECSISTTNCLFRSRTFLLVDAKTPEGKSNLRQQKSSVERFLLVDAKTLRNVLYRPPTAFLFLFLPTLRCWADASNSENSPDKNRPRRKLHHLLRKLHQAVRKPVTINCAPAQPCPSGDPPVRPRPPPCPPRARFPARSLPHALASPRALVPPRSRSPRRHLQPPKTLNRVHVPRAPASFQSAMAPSVTRVPAARAGAVWALVKRLSGGHTGMVRCCAWSPDGLWIASSSVDKTVHVWDVSTGYGFNLVGHDDSVWWCAWRPDGAQLASASRDGTVRVWDVNSRREVAMLEGHTGEVNCCAWSPDGSYLWRLASASDDGTVRVWDVVTGLEVAKLEGHGGRVESCAWSPDGTYLAGTSSDYTVRVWDVVTWHEVAKLEGHTGEVNCCAWSPDGTQLSWSQLSDVSDGWIFRVWDVSTWQRSRRTDGIIRVWTDSLDAEEFEVGTLQDVCSTHCAWSPHGSRLITCDECDDNTVRVWALTDADTVREPICALTAANTRAEVADTRARRLEGDPEALQQCSLEELRLLLDVVEIAGLRVRDALRRASAADSADGVNRRLF
jgi:hypothetical protein